LETPQAKAEFAKATGAVAVDMETATIAEQCRERGVPLLSIRVISDTARQELPVPFSVCFDVEKERPRVGALLAFLLRHPSRIRAFIRFVRTVGRARRLLSGALLDLVGGGGAT
jgi:adenosylhomocysteine nucleosidase